MAEKASALELGWQQIWGSGKDVGKVMAASWIWAVYPLFIHTEALEGVSRQGSL